MHTLAQLCVRRPVFATMLILSLVVVGIFSYFSLGVDLFPKVDIPTVVVIIANPGASPEEIETEISKKVEDAVNTISQVDEVRSVSSEGQSLVTIQFELSKNGDVAAQEVQNKVNLIVPNLPQTAKQPVVQKFDPDAAPILQIAVSAKRSLRDVTLIADKQIKQKLENARGVGQITIVGGARREIHVDVDPDRLRSYSLTINDVFNALRAQNLELPGGNLNAGARELTVRTTGRIVDAAQFNQITVATREGYVVKVSDIGRAEDSYEEPRSAARLDGVPAVTLIVAKQSGVNTVATADEVKQRLQEISAGLPPDIKAQVISDQSVFIKAAVDNIKRHLIEGSFFAAIIIFMFLANVRTTLIAAIAIPTSIVSTFALMAAMGFTLNQITMLALTLMVGIVIDDAIIVLENVYRYIEEKDMPPFQAAVQGTKEIGLAVMATTLSLLAVFLPVGFMGGIVGRFMSSFGFTSAFAIAVSLLVSLHAYAHALLPLHQAARAGGSRASLLQGLLHLQVHRYLLHAHAYLEHGAPRRCGRAQRGRDPVDCSALHVRRQKLPAAGRPVAVQRPDPHSRRHLHRSHHQPCGARRAGGPRTARCRPHPDDGRRQRR